MTWSAAHMRRIRDRVWRRYLAATDVRWARIWRKVSNRVADRLDEIRREAAIQ